LKNCHDEGQIFTCYKDILISIDLVNFPGNLRYLKDFRMAACGLAMTDLNQIQHVIKILVHKDFRIFVQFSNNFVITPIRTMKSFLIVCALLAFASVGDAVKEFIYLQRLFNSLSVEDIDQVELPPSEIIRKEELKCFLKEFRKDENNERINVSASLKI
jgi:hypothetical protein